MPPTNSGGEASSGVEAASAGAAMQVALLSHIPAILVAVGWCRSAAELELTWQQGLLELPAGSHVILFGIWLPGWLLWLMACCCLS